MASFEIVEQRTSGEAFSKRRSGKWSMLVQKSNQHGGQKETR